MLATQGNFNNDIGLPLTLLRLRAQHRVAVLELGMNHPGEIAYLAGIARPTVALVNNAQREHQEFMATVEAVARENGSVLAALAGRRHRRVPGRRRIHAAVDASCAGARACLTFGDAARRRHRSGRVLNGRAAHWQVGRATPAGPLDFRLHIAGRHNVRNALAAAACALAAGVPLAAIAAGAGGVRAGQGPLARAARVQLARPHAHAGGRHLQRQSRFGARRHRRAGRTARPAPAGAGRHGRGRRPGAAVPCRGGRLRARARHRAAVHAGRAVAAAAWAGRHFADIDALNAAVLRAAAARRPACWSRARAS